MTHLFKSNIFSYNFETIWPTRKFITTKNDLHTYIKFRTFFVLTLNAREVVFPRYAGKKVRIVLKKRFKMNYMHIFFHNLEVTQLSTKSKTYSVLVPRLIRKFHLKIRFFYENYIIEKLNFSFLTWILQFFGLVFTTALLFFISVCWFLFNQVHLHTYEKSILYEVSRSTI